MKNPFEQRLYLTHKEEREIAEFFKTLPLTVQRSVSKPPPVCHCPCCAVYG